LDPRLIDFSKPGYPPGMSAEKVYVGLKLAEDEMARVRKRGFGKRVGFGKGVGDRKDVLS
jgi:hypothetical protein